MLEWLSRSRRALRAWLPVALVGATVLTQDARAQNTVRLEGTKSIWLHPKQGERVDIGTVVFAPTSDGKTTFKLSVNHARMKDYFLSMREFKCLEGAGEVFCHVPYPYPQPSVITSSDLAWLEHSLMFMFKLPSEFGAKLWNGVYFHLKAEGKALVGTPQAVDLNAIGAPPAKANVPPYPAAKRDDIREGTRWFYKMTIE